MEDMEVARKISERQKRAAKKHLELRESFEEALRKYGCIRALMMFLNEGQQLSMELPPALDTRDFYNNLVPVFRALEAAERRMAKMEVLLKMAELELLMMADPGHYDSVIAIYKTAFKYSGAPPSEADEEFKKEIWGGWIFLTNASDEMAEYLPNLADRLGIDCLKFQRPYNGTLKPQMPVSGNNSIWVKYRSN